MRYIEGGSSVRKHDVCHYMITLDDSLKNSKKPYKIQLRVAYKAADVNFYIYEGKDRSSATKSLVSGNV